MKFKEFYYQTEKHDIQEGPKGRKVGEFLGSMAGLTVPALAGSAISGNMMDGGMFDKHGAPGGVLGTGLGVMKGRHVGSAVGGAIGDKIGDGMGWLKNKLFGKRIKPGNPNSYFDKLTGGRDFGNPDEVTFKADKANNDEKGILDKEYFSNREKMDKAAKTLALILNDKELDLGYSPHEIMQIVTNVGDSNRILRAWTLHKFDQMVADALKAGHPGTARMLGKRSIEELQKAGVMPPPSSRLPVHSEPNEDEPVHDLAHDYAHEPKHDEVPNIDQPTMHAKHVDLFGDEIPTKIKKPKKVTDPSKPKPKRASRAKRRNDTPSLFDL